MRWKIAELTEAYAKEICEWKYDGLYSVYNYPGWDIVSEQKWAISNEEKRKNEFFAVVDEQDRLCGYIRLVNQQDFVLIGIGLKPSLCGQGFGTLFMNLVKEQCGRRYPEKKMALEVRSFNERAVKCYRKAGFEAVRTYRKDTPIGPGEFIRMEFCGSASR